MIQNIFQLMEYRESADPAYPEVKASKYTDVFNSIGVKGKKLKIGVGGYLVSNPIQLAGLKECYPGLRDRARRRHHGRPAQHQVGKRNRLHPRRPADHRDRHARKSSATSARA